MLKKSLFIFRRDLRLKDNIALYHALNESIAVIPCFIFDPRQVKNNKYKSKNALQFLIESLEDLKDEIHRKNGRLYIFYGQAEEVVKNLIKEENLNAIYINKDYTPFSINRDSAIEKMCIKQGVSFYSYDDALLNRPENILNKSGKPYTVFTPFYNYSRSLPVNNPLDIKHYNFFLAPIKSTYKKDLNNLLEDKNPTLAFHGGRKNALVNLRILNKNTCTKLSPHIKFGTCSVREVYYKIRKKLGENHPLIRQLYWRDFFYHIAFHFPHVFGKPFYKKYNSIIWSKNKDRFKAWCSGKTGFPIIDAGMRELNTTGFINNRIRMIVASFLVKDLHIDWQKGERYFAQKLIDYDPCINNGNWQWVASTGCDASPYFRIFNPWIQQKKFDSNCKYIKKWIPELQNLSSKQIHNLWKNPIKIKNYTSPIISHKIESKISKELYSKTLRK